MMMMFKTDDVQCISFFFYNGGPKEEGVHGW
jgi:hypothetical protein